MSVALKNEQGPRVSGSRVSTGVLVDPRVFLHDYAAVALAGRAGRSSSGDGRGRAEPTRSQRQPSARGEVRPSRQSLVGVVLLLVLIIAGLLGSQVARANDGPNRRPVVARHQVVSVQPGDSLWSIARSIQPTGDVRPLVDAMIAERGSSVLRVGDTVMVPLSGP
jgi:hypothetical protein